MTLARISPKVAQARPISRAFGTPVALADAGRPCDRRPVPADQRDSAAQQAHGRRLFERPGEGDPNDVLENHVRDGHREQNHQRLAAGQEVPDARIDADGREEIDQQEIPGAELEVHPDTGQRIDEGRNDGQQQAPRDRLRNAELSQDADGIVQPLADEQHEDAEGDGQERIDVQYTVVEFEHGPPGFTHRSLPGSIGK